MTKIDGRKYWWVPASMAFAPAMIGIMPRCVDNGLLQMFFIVVGCSMQVGVHAFFFRHIPDLPESKTH